MKLSVAVVTFQEVDYVRQAVLSALRQNTTFPFEVVVGDDASTDGTRAVLEELRRDWPDRLRLVLAERNYGDYGLTNFLHVLTGCRGEYIALLDGDDYWTAADKLQQQVDFFAAHPECAVVGHTVEHRRDDGFREVSRHRDGTGVYDVGALLIDNFAHKISCVHRADNIAQLPEWFRTTRVASADWVFNVLGGRFGKIGFIDEVMGIHRKRKQSLSTGYGMPRMLADRLLAFDHLRPHFPEHGDAIAKAERRIRWKMRIARLGPRAYDLAKRLRVT